MFILSTVDKYGKIYLLNYESEAVAMDLEVKKKVAYDLTMEYIRQSKTLHDCYQDIPEKVEEIDKIYNSFYDSLKDKNIIKQ